MSLFTIDALSRGSTRSIEVRPEARGVWSDTGPDLAIIGSLGFARVGDVLYVRLLCPGKHARRAS